MANEAKIIISAKDKATKTIRRIAGAIRGSLAGAANIAKKATKGLLVGLGALTAASVAAIKVFSDQETAERRVSEATKALGEDATVLLAKYKALANAIQDATGIGDEETLSNIALAKSLGVMDKDIETVIKGMVALKNVGVEGSSAVRMLTNAVNGDYNMLRRYIPAIREVEGEYEQMQVLQTFIERGFKVQAGTLNTIAGRWGELKGRLGDAVQAIVAALGGGEGGLSNALANISDRVKQFTADVDAGKFKGFIGAMKEAAQYVGDIARGLADADARGSTLKALGGIILAAFKDGSGYIIEAIGGGFKYGVQVISAWMPTWQKLLNPLASKKSYETSRQISQATVSALRPSSYVEFSGGNNLRDAIRKMTRTINTNNVGSSSAGLSVEEFLKRSQAHFLAKQSGAGMSSEDMLNIGSRGGAPSASGVREIGKFKVRGTPGDPQYVIIANPPEEAN